VVGFSDLKIHRFFLEQFDGEAKPLNGLIQILPLDSLWTILNVGDESGGSQGVMRL
jgi:hypothetical protein